MVVPAGDGGCAGRILGLGPRRVIVKGGHLKGDAVDVFYNGRAVRTFRSTLIVVFLMLETGLAGAAT